MRFSIITLIENEEYSKHIVLEHWQKQKIDEKGN